MKILQNIEIYHYDSEWNKVVRYTAPVTSDAIIHFELMNSHYCKLVFKDAKAVSFALGDFIETPKGRFEIVSLPTPKLNGQSYSYEIQFDAYYRKWKNRILKYLPRTGSPESSFTLTSSIGVHGNVIIDNLSSLANKSKSYLYDPLYQGEGTDFVLDIDDTVDTTKAKVISYSSTSILDALTDIANAFECEWWIEGNIIHFGTCENENAVTDFRLDENVANISTSPNQSSYSTRVYAFGAARNLPTGYKKNESVDITKDGVVERRLMLPTIDECSDANKELLEKNGFELTKYGCVQVKGLDEDQYVEGVTTNDDIYPRNLIKTSSITTFEREVENTSTNDEEDTITRTFYRLGGLAIVDDDGKKTGDMAFRSSYILSGQTLHIIFQSGSLNGMDFECHFNPEGKPEILYDNDGNPLLENGKEQINPESQVFEIMANENYGRFLPDPSLCPKDGDTFVLYNWDSSKLGTTLITSASNELLVDTIEHLKKSMIDSTNYTCEMAADYSIDNYSFGEGDRVNLYYPLLPNGMRQSRIIGYEVHLDIPWDSVKYIVGEKPTKTKLGTLENKVEELTFKGQVYASTQGGNNIYIIKSYDSVEATDYNVYSARRSDLQYLFKNRPDSAQSLITFLKGLSLGGDYKIDEEGNGRLNNLVLNDVTVDRVHDAESTEAQRVIVGAQGFDLYKGSDGRAHLWVDDLNVRNKFFASALEVRKVSYSGGEILLSNAGSTIAKVACILDGDRIIAYKCYVKADDGTTATQNWWKPGMMAMCRTFDIKPGVYKDVSNRYYWRLCVGAGQETLKDGRLYSYVVLSDVESFVGNDAIIPDYRLKPFSDGDGKIFTWGGYAVSVIAKDAKASFSDILAEDGITKDDGGTDCAKRVFYGKDPLSTSIPMVGDVIVQAGDEVRWTSRGNVIRITTSTDDDQSGNAPSMTMYHKMGAPYSTGKDADGNDIISVWQWKTVTSVISPTLTLFNSDNVKFFSGTPDNIVDAIVIDYYVKPSDGYVVRHVGNGTTTPERMSFSVTKRTGNKTEDWSENVAKIRIDYTTTDGTDGSRELGMNEPFTDFYDCMKIRATAIGKDGKELATTDIPVVSDGDDYDVRIVANGGNSIFNGEGSKTLTAYVYKNGFDITGTIDKNAFSWKRDGGDEENDKIWNMRHENYGNVCVVTNEDIYRSALFTCDVQI